MADDKEVKRTLTEEEVEEIKRQLLKSIYADIGKSLVMKALWVMGILGLVLVAFLHGS